MVPRGSLGASAVVKIVGRKTITSDTSISIPANGPPALMLWEIVETREQYQLVFIRDARARKASRLRLKSQARSPELISCKTFRVCFLVLQEITFIYRRIMYRSVQSINRFGRGSNIYYSLVFSFRVNYITEDASVRQSALSARRSNIFFFFFLR